MINVKIGLDVTGSGLSFYGWEKVNDLISKGGRVISIAPTQFFLEPAESSSSKEDEEVTLKGWQMNVQIDSL